MPKIPKETLESGTAFASPCGDLRRASTQYKRWHDQKTKWRFGNRLKYYNVAPMFFQNIHEKELARWARQPAPPLKSMSAEHDYERWVNHGITVKNRTMRYDIESILEDEFDSGHEITSLSDGGSDSLYPQFDINQLPTAGQTALAAATDLAVQKYRDKQAKKESREIRRSWEFISHDEDLFGVSDDDLRDEDYLIVSAHDAV